MGFLPKISHQWTEDEDKIQFKRLPMIHIKQQSTHTFGTSQLRHLFEKSLKKM